ncbi:ead/Ea22-like family protein [Enterobacter sp. DE0047]|uniref:ead/Ea22-like family protein n=1 Tax=Enterobacter sp. DE0047 TaxID=2584949 RepID=UPI00256FE101|nr:ead/Ea22-like family protein [Enterobacter sp. DE0047]
MSDKYAALRAAAETAKIESNDEWGYDTDAFHDEATPETILALLAEREADKTRIAQLETERDALREGEMGDAKHSNTRAAADIYFQLVEECNIPAGGSLVEYVDELRDRIAELESRKVKLPSLNPQMFNDDVMFGYRKAQKEAVEFCAAAGITLETGE